jgi:TonB-dependent receptor
MTVRTTKKGLVHLLLASAALAAPSSVVAQDDLSEEELAALMAEDPSLAALMSRPQLETGTGVVGRVMAEDIDAPVIEGQVVVVETDQRVLTNVEGYYAIDLPPGTYTLRIFYQLYQTARLAGVVVRAGEATEADATLVPDSAATEEEFVVEARADTNTAATQQMVRRQATEVRDSISAEEMSRTTDSAAAGAARRVVAVTVYDDFLYVRGLGGRYTTVLLDGSPLPQLDPAVPGVQLDLFPNSVLSSVSVLKSYSPHLPATFAGGTMLLQTREYPEEFEANASMRMGVNSETTFGSAPGYSGGGLDFLGFDDGTRAIPSAVPTDAQLRAGADLSRDEVEEIGRSFPGNLSVYPRKIGPDLSVGLNLGDTLDLFGHDLGVYVAGGYRVSNRTTREEIGSVLDVNGTPGDSQERTANETSVRLSALGSLDLELARGHNVSYTGFFNQSADDYAATQDGYQEERDDDIRRTRQRWTQRTIFFNQLAGHHELDRDGPSLDWRLNLTSGRMYEPDTRDVLYQRASEQEYTWVDRLPIDGQRLYTNLDELRFGGAADLTIPVGDYAVKAGALVSHSNSDYEIRRFDYTSRRRADPELFGLPPNDLFVPEMSGEAWTLLEITNEDDSFVGTEDTYGAYAMVQGEATDWLRGAVGFRTEAFRQTITPSSPFFDPAEEEDPPDTTARTDVDVLPSAGLVFELMDDMFVRGGYSATVARPRLRELSGSVFVDFQRNRTLFGNPDTRRTLIHSVDLRWELFPSNLEVIAVSGFVKVFEDPIELVILDRNRVVSFTNVAGAQNVGAEVEARISLGHIADPLRMLWIGGNFTLMHSQVSLTDEQAAIATTTERPLAGQSPWMANASFGVAPADGNLSVFVNYNVYGPRIDEVGAVGIPDTYEQPFHDLELTARWNVLPTMSLKASVSNLLYSSRRFEAGGLTVRAWNPGISGRLGLSWSTD